MLLCKRMYFQSRKLFYFGGRFIHSLADTSQLNTLVPLSVFTIESVALILEIAKDNGTIARKTGSPFVQFISREISQATSSLTFSTRNSILETRDSILETRDSILGTIEARGSRDCQLTFERYCRFDVWINCGSKLLQSTQIDYRFGAC